jgi:hypothetical protein
VTGVAALTVPANTVNVADVAPAETVTLAGTLAAALELESDTTAPPVGAAAVSVTVPVPVCPLTIVLGLTDSPLSAAAAGLTVRPKVSFTPEYDAVKVTAVGVVTDPALTVNIAEVEPCGIVTLDGSLVPAGDELRVMIAPPLGAADDKATMQLAVDGGMRDTELHENPSRPTGTIVTVPPVVEIGSDDPVASDASLFVSCTDDDVSVVVLDTVSDTVATTPLSIGASRPESTQIAEPALLLQDSDLPAAAGPAATVADEKSTVE